MSHACQLCHSQSNEMNFFDEDGKEVQSSQSPKASVCTPCLEAIGEYDSVANVHFMWNDLTEEQQSQILPYINGTARYDKWLAVFDLEDFDGETFEDWLTAVSREYARWVPSQSGVQ